MKTLYIECSMGCAGDMLTGALLELLPEPDDVIGLINRAGIPGVTVSRERAESHGVVGTRVAVKIDGREEDEAGEGQRHHHHAGMADIRAIVNSLNVALPIKNHVLAVYDLIAEAESKVHGAAVSEVHFHEVGMADAIADILGVSLILERLHPDEIVVSPVHVGSGRVKCAHGWLPVPAPATAEILKGVPIYSADVDGELCTPTGAALLKHFATRFGSMPRMVPDGVGYGMGTRPLPVFSAVRALIGEREEASARVLQLSFNVDDMTAEDIAFAAERLFEAGAYEVFTVPVTMKKSRPGTLVRVSCAPEKRDGLLRAIFRHTSTNGVSEAETVTHTLKKYTVTASTPFGPVRVKRSEGFGAEREKPEYEDVARIAREHGLSLREIKDFIE